MLTAISHKTKQFSLVLIKIGLVVGVFYFIYTKLFLNSNLHFDEFLHYLIAFSSISVNTLLILVLLSIFNWFLEILKWQTLTASISEISVIEAATQTLGAFTASLLTPNRIGDYGAKAMYYPPHLRKKIMLLNLIGNSAQMAITTIFGSIGFMYFALHFQPELNYNNLIIWFGFIGVTTPLLIWIVRSKRLDTRRNSLYKLRDFIQNIPKKTLFKTALFSTARYLIFSFQFYYLLLLFGVEINYFAAMATISSMYLLSSIIPSIFIFDLIIKGGVAIYLFGLIGIHEAIILAIVTLMWILNFVLPSVIGSYHVLNFKLPKTVS